MNRILTPASPSSATPLPLFHSTSSTSATAPPKPSTTSSLLHQSTNSYYSPYSYGKENSHAQTTPNHAPALVALPPPPPSSTAAASTPTTPVPKYSHPNSPTPTNLSSFSPRLSQSTNGAGGPLMNLPLPSPITAHSPAFATALPPSPSSSTFSYSPYPSPQPVHHAVPVPARQQPAPVLNTYHRPIAQAQEPTMDQLLSTEARGGGAYSKLGRFAAGAAAGAQGDVTMGNATGVVSWRKGQGFKEWEKVRLNSPEVKRKADVAQLFFYDHYFDLLTYLSARRTRLTNFRDSLAARPSLTPSQANAEWTSYKGRERVLLRKRRTKLKLNQFHVLTQVGQGGYGEVYLARHKETGSVVALKKMRKRTLLKMDEIRHVLTERDILASTNSPWLVRLLYAFQDPTHVYLAMDFIAGGDFRTLLNNSGVLKEEHARFYISEMFCSVAELHKLGYIHRDLKPENFLIDPSGHIKLTDFGLAAGALNPGKIENLKHKLDEVKDQDLIYRTTVEMKSIYKSIRMSDPRYADSVVGSPDYMAIETLRGSSYSFSVDYWSLGCILFEFLAGFPPFSGATSDETWANLKNWHKTLRRPHYDRPEDRIFNLSDVGWSAITALITTKERRLSTMDQIKAHPFFKDVPWTNLRDSKAPFVPALDSEVDSGYFDDFTSEADMKKYAEVREKQKNVDRVKEKEEKFGRGVWIGFTFKSKVGEAPVTEFIDGDDELVELF
ncbi:serine/threonine protein kinase [Pseudohyphozyma bogoriensis]|nr:serine/threonine protein kinase [Pseudohyphozyma bogoriensis]